MTSLKQAIVILNVKKLNNIIINYTYIRSVFEYMGGGNEEKHFGNLAHLRGIVYYRLSPHEQKVIGSAAVAGIANFVPRTFATIFTWLPRESKSASLTTPH